MPTTETIVFKFPLGHVYATAAVTAWVESDDDEQHALRQLFLLDALKKHARGDWGDVDPDDLGINDAALVHGARLVSVYPIPSLIMGDAPDEKLWVITEADRAATTFLFPSDY